MQEKCELDKIKDQRKVVRIALMPKADPISDGGTSSSPDSGSVSTHHSGSSSSHTHHHDSLGSSADSTTNSNSGS